MTSPTHRGGRSPLPVSRDLATALAAWFNASHRTMPWRETCDPYAIWLSEIMLQQTQVETVRGYYDRFLAKWPTIADLAAADDGDVMKAWEGLGYYARCRNLLAAARTIVREHGGEFPREFDQVLALPGIGRSTAGAILTFAFGQRHPILDGNVKRVFSRLLDIAEPVTSKAVDDRLWAVTAQLIGDAPDPWVHNQAVMEFGARQCVPREPKCLLCPLRTFCAAQAAGTVAERPVKVKKPPVPHKQIAVAVIANEGRLYVQQRPHEGLLGGLWEFPGGKQEDGETLPETVRRECREELGITVQVGRKIAEIRHAYSHFRITMHAFLCVQVGDDLLIPHAAIDSRWVTRDQLDSLAFPKANKDLIAVLMGDHPELG